MKRTITIVLIIACSSFANADVGIPPDFNHLKTMRDSKVEEIDRTYQQELKKLQVKYTKRGDLESANFVASVLKEIEEKDSTNNIQPAEVHSKKKFTDFKKGIPVNPDAPSSLCYHDIPEMYEGFEVEQIKNSSTAPLVFEVKNGGTVMVVAEKSTAEVLIQAGWKFVDHASVASSKTMEHYREISILQKSFEKGEYAIPVKRSRFGCRLLKQK